MPAIDLALEGIGIFAGLHLVGHAMQAKIEIEHQRMAISSCVSSSFCEITGGTPVWGLNQQHGLTAG